MGTWSSMRTCSTHTLAWAGLPLEYVIGDSEFYEDVLDNAGALELTVMALPVRPLPLAALRENLIQRLAPRLGEVHLQPSLCLGIPQALRMTLMCETLIQRLTLRLGKVRL